MAILSKKRKLVLPMICRQFLFICLILSGIAGADVRYEAENSIVDENMVQKIQDSRASEGFYVNMKDGELAFNVDISTSGFYAIYVNYSQPYDTNGKIQNFSVNGVKKGQMSFPYTDTFVTMKAVSKVKLSKSTNTLGIVKSWGWVNVDYIEIKPWQENPFSISNDLVTPNASENTRKMYCFLKQHFQKKIISGVMTNTVMENDGNYTPNTVENQTEVAWISNASGKIPALLGFDLFHGTGKNSDSEWHEGYNNATLSLAEDIYKKGGFPSYCWHWKDPSQKVEAFYSESSGNSKTTDFNLSKAYIDPKTCNTFDTSSEEYKAIIKDLDIAAGYLKILADKDIPVLWRPLHEASGKWFWWGYSGADACKGLYRLMFDRFTSHHGLNNLIWIWTSDEAGNALDWYPGDDCVDIIGRDYYYYPREANHGSLAASFEKVKEIYKGTKIIALTENGSIPHPDSLTNDGAGWSYFMPWYGDYTMDGWAHDNTAADWKSIMNNRYVITLDQMPGWDRVSTYPDKQKKHLSSQVSISFRNGFIECVLKESCDASMDIYTMQGKYITGMQPDITLKTGINRLKVKGIAEGLYLVRFKKGTNVISKSIIVTRSKSNNIF